MEKPQIDLENKMMVYAMKDIILRVLALLLFLLFCPVTGQAGTVDMAESGQKQCFNTLGGQINCLGTGQDGEKRSGLSWPTPRFNDNTDGTLTDHLTGLMWLQDGACLPPLNEDWALFLDALDSNQGLLLKDCINYSASYEDWRLPNINELTSLINDGVSDLALWLNAHGFKNMLNENYLSSTSADIFLHWGVNMVVGDAIQSGFDRHYLLVRNATNQAARVWKTGQVDQFVDGDDGDLQKGIEWPLPRFNQKTNETISDGLTGLIWSSDAETPGPVDCNPKIKKNWQAALDHISCLNIKAYLGHQDWRLPNRKELLSLIDYSQIQSTASPLPTGHPFLNIQQDLYWSSTADLSETAKAATLIWQMAVQAARLKEISTTFGLYEEARSVIRMSQSSQ